MQQLPGQEGNYLKRPQLLSLCYSDSPSTQLHLLALCTGGCRRTFRAGARGGIPGGHRVLRHRGGQEDRKIQTVSVLPSSAPWLQLLSVLLCVVQCVHHFPLAIFQLRIQTLSIYWHCQSPANLFIVFFKNSSFWFFVVFHCSYWVAIVCFVSSHSILSYPFWCWLFDIER